MRSCSCTGATGPAPLHAAAEPSVVAAAPVQLRCDLATAEDIAPTTEGSHPVANFQATYILFPNLNEAFCILGDPSRWWITL